MIVIWSEEEEMQKQCTNSTCRRHFTVSSSPCVCPWCGKTYPRIKARVGTLVLYNFGNGKLLVIKAVKMLATMGLIEAKRRVEMTASGKPVRFAVEKADGIAGARKLLRESGAKYRFTAR